MIIGHLPAGYVASAPLATRLAIDEAARRRFIWAGMLGSIAPLTFAFAFNGFMHLLLDSIVGDIWWFAPFVDQSFALFTVPALYQPWWLNFVLHWSFALELAVVAWAVYFLKVHHTSAPRHN